MQKSNITIDTDVRIIKRVTLVGFWINTALVILKLSIGYWGHSDALVADGYHSLSDFITDFIVLIFVGLAYKRADKEHPYGHGKYETVASVLIGIMLLLVAIYIFTEGCMQISNFLRGESLIRPDVWTIWVAIISIAAKEYCFRYTIKYGKKLDSSVLIANAWHHRSDAYSSIATVAGVSAAYFLGPDWRILDPAAAIIISIFIAISAINIAKPSINELLEVSLPEEEQERIISIIKTVDGVKRVHDMRSRKNGRSFIIDVNVHVDPDITVRAAHEIATGIEIRLKKEFSNHLIIYIHIEPEI